MSFNQTGGYFPIRRKQKDYSNYKLPLIGENPEINLVGKDSISSNNIEIKPGTSINSNTDYFNYWEGVVKGFREYFFKNKGEEIDLTVSIEEPKFTTVEIDLNGININGVTDLNEIIQLSIQEYISGNDSTDLIKLKMAIHNVLSKVKEYLFIQKELKEISELISTDSNPIQLSAYIESYGIKKPQFPVSYDEDYSDIIAMYTNPSEPLKSLDGIDTDTITRVEQLTNLINTVMDNSGISTGTGKVPEITSRKNYEPSGNLSRLTKISESLDINILLEKLNIRMKLKAYKNLQKLSLSNYIGLPQINRNSSLGYILKITGLSVILGADMLLLKEMDKKIHSIKQAEKTLDYRMYANEYKDEIQEIIARSLKLKKLTLSMDLDYLHDSIYEHLTLEELDISGNKNLKRVECPTSNTIYKFTVDLFDGKGNIKVDRKLYELASMGKIELISKIKNNK